jgi:hypothetical protein
MRMPGKSRESAPHSAESNRKKLRGGGGVRRSIEIENRHRKGVSREELLCFFTERSRTVVLNRNTNRV